MLPLSHLERFIVSANNKECEKKGIPEVKQKINLQISISCFAFIAVLFFPIYVFAAFNISAQPYEGGSDLRFGRVDVATVTNKEVILTVTTDIAKQYQVTQTLLTPLTNDQGASLSRDNFSVYAIRGSNSYGTVLVENETPVSLGRTIIYTSSSQGHQDSFKLVYSLKSPFSVPSGVYRGRIAFTLEAIDSSQQPVTTILNVLAEISVESNIELKTATGSKIIVLNSSNPATSRSDVLVDIKGSMGSQFRIIQALSGPLESNEGLRLAFEAVNVKVSNAKLGSAPTEGIPLSLRQEALYISGTRPQADNFIVTYSLAEAENQKAGRYKTNIKYLLDGINLTDTIGDLELQVEIARLFDLKITPQMGGVIEFRDLKPQQPPQQSEVLIEIKSNIGRRYQVNQRLFSDLANKEGRSIPSQYFTLKQESVETKGTLQFPMPTEVKSKEMILFVSDKEGSSDKFKVIYTLTPSTEIIAGDYSARITYSISEI
jgi:hypothetical protein